MVLSFVFFGLSILFGLLVLFVLGSSFSACLSFFPCSFSVNGGIFEFTCCLDSSTVICLIMLVVCSLLAFIYCFHYYYGSLDAFSLLYLMVWFVLVMLILIVTSSPIFTLVMWEYLGFVSFLLILFYSNSSSVRASLITLFSSRFGDVGLFVVLVYLYCGGPFSWFFFFVFFLVIISKSAGFPFVSWLLEAMRAPTPVSSLVHSSTLVAAGVWFMVRYGYFLDSVSVFYLFVFSIFTIFVTAVSALFFLDLKKIVALSTCNNVAWCLVYYICNDPYLVVFQLLVHGVCKCSLFILVGDLMSSSGSSQSSVGLYLSRYGGLYNALLLVFLVFCLCGLPFLGIYFSKHFFFIFLVGSCYNLLLVFFVLFGFFLSYVYSFRLSLLVCSKVYGISFGYLASFIFVSFFVILGTFFGWFILGQYEEYSVLVPVWSLFFLFVQLFGCLAGYCFYNSSFFGWFWQSILFGSDSLVGLFYSFYSFLVGVSSLVIYRWEVVLLFSFGRFFGSSGGSLFYFSLNFIILGIFSFFLFGFVLG
uniref:NADH:ubiquinone reductase (H(+)-translocating) n=1 Tax=Hysteromorpha triloba TaxID=234889 RepID=A0A6J3YQC7_9TREM|nr:NADH dehydrogenase subunit 5 [Hysteromorpha triloba]